MFGVIAATPAATVLFLFASLLLASPAVFDTSSRHQRHLHHHHHHQTRSNRSPPPKVLPTVNITAVFEHGDLDDFKPVFEKAVGELHNHSNHFVWHGHAILAKKDLRDMVTQLCTHFYGDRSNIRLIIVFGRVDTVQTVNLISESMGIPVIGYMLDKGDGYVQVSLYVCCTSFGINFGTF